MRQIVQTQTQPEWFVSPPADTAAEFWGVGEGPDIDSATRAGLRQIAGRLRVSVSAVTNSSVTVAQQSVYRTDQTRLQEVVRETEFTGVTVSQSVRHANGVYTLIRVDRRAFIRETVARFDDHYKRVAEKARAAEASDPVGQYRQLRMALPDADQVLNIGQLLRVVDASALDQSAMTVSSSIRQRLTEAASKIWVRVDHSPVDADLAAVVAQWLTQAGFQRVSTNHTAVLSLHVQSRTEAVFNTWNCRLGMSLNWFDTQGSSVAGRTVEVNGSSLESAQRARQNAVRAWTLSGQGSDPAVLLGLL